MPSQKIIGRRVFCQSNVTVTNCNVYPHVYEDTDVEYQRIGFMVEAIDSSSTISVNGDVFVYNPTLISWFITTGR